MALIGSHATVSGGLATGALGYLPGVAGVVRIAAARMARAAGASLLRGGAFKPRSSPYAFQGLGEAGLKILADVRAETGCRW